MDQFGCNSSCHWSIRTQVWDYRTITMKIFPFNFILISTAIYGYWWLSLIPAASAFVLMVVIILVLIKAIK